jgi:hypothetical protein
MLRTSRPSRSALVLLTFVACGCLSSSAEGPQNRLLAAAEHSHLDSAALKPWHLKIDVTLYGENGKDPISGTIERWNADNGNRTIFTFGDAKRIVLNDRGRYYSAHSGPEVPALADGVLAAMLNPGPSSHQVETS